MSKKIYIFIILLALLFPIPLLVEEKIKTIETKAEPDFINMAFEGDIMLDRGVRNSVTKNFAGDYSQLFKNADILKKFDIVFANLEGTASDKGKNAGSIYSFHMDPAVIPVLKGAGINILSVANNHVADWGLKAYVDNLARLKTAGIPYAGGGQNKTEAETPTIIIKHGIKIGFLGFSDVGPDYMQASETRAGILSAKGPNFDEIIKNAAAQVDFLIVSFHFGTEYKTMHNKRQEYLAHEAVDDGAKIVIGAHPHVVEDFETYKNSFIAYSLGNFIFDQSWSEPTMKGMLLEIKLYKNGEMAVTKDPTQLNSFFQLEKIIEGEEEKVVFE
ncbi:CapA family protein [Candidatus Nomurabacteria bacterium]|nr:CapA family protein [Candidatus Nomurabacteria bacterium]